MSGSDNRERVKGEGGVHSVHRAENGGGAKIALQAATSLKQMEVSANAKQALLWRVQNYGTVLTRGVCWVYLLLLSALPFLQFCCFPVYASILAVLLLCVTVICISLTLVSCLFACMTRICFCLLYSYVFFLLELL